MRQLAAIIALPIILSAFGCNGGSGENIFAVDSGSLLYAYDVIVPPGIQTPLCVKFRSGPFLAGREQTQIRFSLDGVFLGSAITDENGECAINFTPEQTGDYLFNVEVDPIGFDGKCPTPVTLLLSCRNPNQQIIVVDLDKTLVADGFDKVLTGKASPMPDSVEVMQSLAGKNTIVYLTHRPDLLGPKSKMWLADNKDPAGPLLLSKADQFIEGSENFKSHMLEKIKGNFPNANIGIGDKISDAKAYMFNGLRPYLIVSIPPDAGSYSLKRLAASLDGLDDRVQVVLNWRQIEEGILTGKEFPKRVAQLEILHQASR